MASNTCRRNPPTLEFITLTNTPAIKDPIIGQKIRSHVMRKWKRDKREAYINATHNGSVPTRSDPRLQVSTVSASDRDMSVILSRRNDTTLLTTEHLGLLCSLPRTVLDSSRSEQFNCLPTALTPKSDVLIDYFFRMRPGKAGLPCTPTGPYIRQMFSHGVSMKMFRMEAALLHRMNAADPNFGATEYYYNMVDTIRHVNKSLDHRTERYSDITLAAMNLLGICEVHTGNFQNAERHFDALQKLVVARGGLQTLGWNGILATQIYWYDNTWAMAKMEAPRFPVKLTEIPGNGLRIEDARNGSATQMSFEDFLSLLKELSCTCEIQRPFRDTQFLNVYGHRIQILENQIVLFVHAPSEKQDHDRLLLKSYGIRQAFHLCAYMFGMTILRGWPFQHQVYIAILQRTASILKQDNTVCDILSLKVLFWTLFAAAVFGADTLDGPFFRGRLQTTTKYFNLQDWESARELLQEIAWVPSYCEEQWRSTWNKTMHGQEAMNYEQPLHEFQNGWNDIRAFLKGA